MNLGVLMTVLTKDAWPQDPYALRPNMEAHPASTLSARMFALGLWAPPWKPRQAKVTSLQRLCRCPFSSTAEPSRWQRPVQHGAEGSPTWTCPASDPQNQEIWENGYYFKRLSFGVACNATIGTSLDIFSHILYFVKIYFLSLFPFPFELVVILSIFWHSHFLVFYTVSFLSLNRRCFKMKRLWWAY